MVEKLPAYAHFASPGDIGPALTAARLSIPNLVSEVQALFFSEDYGGEESYLMEISEEQILQLENGSR